MRSTGRPSLTRALSLSALASMVLLAATSSCGDDSNAGGGTSTSSATAGPTTPAATSTATGTSTSTATSSTASSGAGGAPFDCSSLPLCDDFEGAAVDGPPDETKWAVVQPDCGGGPATVTIDDTVSHSGQKSVRVEGGLDYCDHKFFADQNVIGTLGPEVFGRFYIRFADPIGQNHITFLSMKDENAGNKNLRMGGQGHVLMYNRETDDAVLPSNFDQSLEPAALTWYCIEFRINGPDGEIETWIDGDEAPGLRVDGTPTDGVDNVWLQDNDWHPSLKDYRLGWESYSNQAMTVWFDDVALSTSRIGCQ